MGYLRPVAIIVTGTYGDHAEEAHAKALEIFDVELLTYSNLKQTVGSLIEGVANGTKSFLVAWDGSKEGWAPSDEGDSARARFVEWLNSQAYDDGSSPLDWVEVQYGGDDNEVITLAHGGESWHAAQSRDAEADE